MTVKQLKDMVMIQTNNDLADITEYETQVLSYLNEGHTKLYEKYMGEVPATPLANDADESSLPGHMHRYIADWATWRMYMNGNTARQQRGLPFRQSFDAFLSDVKRGGGITDAEKLAARNASLRFINLYTEA